MARIIYSGLVTSIRGSIGGTTFQNNAYGFTAKNKPNMIKPNSVPQSLSKIILSKAVKGWSTITDSDRASWNTFADTFPQFAKNNPSSQLSGYAAFVKWHTTFFLGAGVGAAYVPEPVTAMPTIDTVIFSLSRVASVLTLAYNWTLADGEWQVNVYISRPFLASQNFIGTSPRFLISITNDDDSSNIASLYSALFGRLPNAGEVVNVEYELYPDAGGQVLARASQRLIVI
jgi:hypothetical protein